MEATVPYLIILVHFLLFLFFLMENEQTKQLDAVVVHPYLNFTFLSEWLA